MRSKTIRTNTINLVIGGTGTSLIMAAASGIESIPLRRH